MQANYDKILKRAPKPAQQSIWNLYRGAREEIKRSKPSSVAPALMSHFAGIRRHRTPLQIAPPLHHSPPRHARGFRQRNTFPLPVAGSLLSDALSKMQTIDSQGSEVGGRAGFRQSVP